MSYRNPQIIVDRSSEIYTQAFAKLGQQAAGMINKYNEQKRLEQERIKKKNDAFKLLQNEVSFKAYQDAIARSLGKRRKQPAKGEEFLKKRRLNRCY